MSTYYVAGLPYSSELYHHGIKGQKWGVRRFQNPDGSLTAAGIKRYGTVENFNKAQQGKTKRGLSDATKRKLKTAAKVAGIAALTGAAAYGAYKVGKGIQKGHENYVDDLVTLPKIKSIEAKRHRDVSTMLNSYVEGIDKYGNDAAPWKLYESIIN